MKIVMNLHDLMEILLGNSRWKKTAEKYSIDEEKLGKIVEKLRKGEFRIF